MRKPRHFLFAHVCEDDKARMHRVAASVGMNVSQLMRAALNDYLDEIGEAPLGDYRYRDASTDRRVA